MQALLQPHHPFIHEDNTKSLISVQATADKLETLAIRSQFRAQITATNH